MIPPDFSTWHAVRSAKPLDLFLIYDPESEYGGCVCYIAGTKDNKILVDILLFNNRVRREYEIHQLSKYPQ